MSTQIFCDFKRAYTVYEQKWSQERQKRLQFAVDILPKLAENKNCFCKYKNSDIQMGYENEWVHI